jgi:arylsulfatase A-like enzyme
MFERGISGHSTNAFYNPVLRIPLMIFEPGRTARLDVHTATSAADILPTLAQLTGHPLPAWTEGVVLPPYAAASPSPDRNVYAARATQNAQDAPLTRASITLVKGRYKLIYYFGYNSRGVDEVAQLYDIQADPEELEDLYSSKTDIAQDLLAELKARLAEVDAPYR